MKSPKVSSSGAKSGVKSKSRGESGSGPPSITESHATLKDRAADNMSAFKKSQKH
jgi:hypothetical protein